MSGLKLKKQPIKFIRTRSPYVLMVEIIKAEVSEALARKSRKRAMEIYGYRKGSVKAALENFLKRFTASGQADWKALKGCIKSDLTSVELQHKLWRRVD